MKKKLAKKTIQGITIFIFAMFFIQAVLPTNALAANNSSLNWDNPNTGNSPYQLKIKDILNSDMIMQVVGCTGIVDKISAKVVDLVKKGATALLKESAKLLVCKSGKAVALGAAGTIIYTTITTAIQDTVNCEPKQRNNDPGVREETKETKDATLAAQKRTECLNGIAKQLARNQLTALTRNTMNWINSGFNGDPMYVRNITSLTNSIEKNILEKEINKLTKTDRAYPYGADFSRSVINSYKTGGSFRSGFDGLTDGLTSDLLAFLKPGYSSTGSYGNEGNYGTGTEKTALERSKEANDSFANDFSTGGWAGWLAFTQRDQNNPLGFTIQVVDSISKQQEENTENTKQELSNNQGFLDQKKCVLWQLYDETGKPIMEYSVEDEMDVYKFGPSKSTAHNYDKCVKFETVTPGSLIGDKVSDQLGSPERQLELAEDINDVLSSLFSVLLDKLYSQGLSTINAGSYDFGDNNMGVGYGSNDLDDSFGFEDNYGGGGYQNGSFDLTRDLGNTYIHTYNTTPLGEWNAKNNLPALYPNIGPLFIDPEDGKEKPIEDANGVPLSNVFYVVSVAGNTKLINDGYNGWAVGDRAFWNGKEWQNWKKDIPKNGKTQITNPVDKRGIIQIQKDYVVAAKEILMTLPSIMPKIGELDYCIPGPNPSWLSNSAEVEAGFREYAGTLSATYSAGAFLKRDSTYFDIAEAGDPEYEYYKSLFSWTSPEYWGNVIHTEHWNELNRLGGTGTVKKDKEEEGVQKEIDDRMQKINVDFEVFKKVFGKQYDYSYGTKSLMLKPFIENESTGILEFNTSWLPMAEVGLSITKNILDYNKQIITETEEYTEAVIQANSNVYRLEAIRIQVSDIIKAAQARRDAKLLTLLNEETEIRCQEEEEDCLNMVGFEPYQIEYYEQNDPDGTLLALWCWNKKGTCLGDKMTEAEYKEKYNICLEGEDIIYFDEAEIMGNTGGDEQERCNDKIDNDLDGLIDGLDPDCYGFSGGGNGGNGGNTNPQCSDGIDNDGDNDIDSNDPNCHVGGIEDFPYDPFHYYENVNPTIYSTFGCRIDPDTIPHPTAQANNTSCYFRTETECTLTKYNYNSSGYDCEFLEI